MDVPIEQPNTSSSAPSSPRLETHVLMWVGGFLFCGIVAAILSLGGSSLIIALAMYACQNWGWDSALAIQTCSWDLHAPYIAMAYVLLLLVLALLFTRSHWKKSHAFARGCLTGMLLGLSLGWVLAFAQWYIGFFYG